MKYIQINSFVGQSANEIKTDRKQNLKHTQTELEQMEYGREPIADGQKTDWVEGYLRGGHRAHRKKNNLNQPETAPPI